MPSPSHAEYNLTLGRLMKAELTAIQNEEFSYRPSTEVLSDDVEVEQIFGSREGSS